MDILEVLKEVKQDLDFIPTDEVSNKHGRYLNRAKNNLMLLIADGEEREAAKALTPPAPSMGKLRY